MDARAGGKNANWGEIPGGRFSRCLFLKKNIGGALHDLQNRIPPPRGIVFGGGGSKRGLGFG